MRRIGAAGKSTAVTALLEQMHELRFQFCVVDPEGDYDELSGAVVIGDSKSPPRVAEIVELLEKPEVNVVANLLAIDTEDRPTFFAGLLPDLVKLRSKTGRPHWLVIDEVHHCLPAEWKRAPITVPKELSAVVAIAVSPDAVSREFLELVSTVACVGEDALDAFGKFCSALGRSAPVLPTPKSNLVQVLTRDGSLRVIAGITPKKKQKRHARKYAEGELSDDRCFYFRGPDAELNLRAQNLATFVQLAEGVDDKTWVHHLRAGDYSRWFREEIKDADLASEASEVEVDDERTPQESRRRMREIIERRYA